MIVDELVEGEQGVHDDEEQEDCDEHDQAPEQRLDHGGRAVLRDREAGMVAQHSKASASSHVTGRPIKCALRPAHPLLLARQPSNEIACTSLPT